MLTISVDEIQKDILAYLRLVKTGETIVITQANEPIAEVKPFTQPTLAMRPFGLCAGQFTVPNDFDSPLPDEITASFEGR